MTFSRGVNRSVIEAAKQCGRDLRARQTKHEGIIWDIVRGRKLCGEKFLRQQPVYVEINGKETFFVPDFLCKRQKLIIEIDGPIHFELAEYDEYRTEILNIYGLRVLRFTNDEIDHDIEAVIKSLKETLISAKR